MIGTDRTVQTSAEGEQKLLSLNEIREIVGLAPTEEGQTSPKANNTTVNILIDDDDFQSDEEPTQRKIWQKPGPKIAAIALPLGMLSLLVGFLLVNLTGIKLAQDATPEETDTTSTDTGEEKSQQQLEEEIAQLKTSNALGNQASVLENQPTRRTEIRPASGVQPETRVSQPTPRAVQHPARQVTTSAPAPMRSRPVAMAQPVPRRPITPAPRFSRPATTQPTITRPVRAQSTSSQPQVDPFEEWQKLASLGSYGQLNSSTNTVVQTQNPASIQTVQRLSNEPIPIMVSASNGQQAIVSDRSMLLTSESRNRPMPKVMRDYRYEKTTAPEAAYTEAEQRREMPIDDEAPLLLTQADYQSGVDFIMGNSAQETPQTTTLFPGISARGEVIAPVAWARDIESTTGAIQLSEDLVSDGAVVMPAGTQLIIALRQMSESGMMDLTITSIILPESGYDYMQIPPQAISVQGAGGHVLMAKNVSVVDSELGRLELGQAFLGALGQVGSVLNRPNSSSSIIGVGGSSSSSDYGSPNVLGAVLQGGANTLISERSARNQQRVEALQERPTVWVLENGTGIEIFINQAVALGGYTE